MKKCLIIGSTVADVTIPVEQLPKSGEDCVSTAPLSIQLGGCAYNASTIFQILNLPYTLFSPIGSGVYGDFVRLELKKRSMGSHLPALGNITQENGCCLCMVEPNGERSFLSIQGAEYVFEEAWFDKIDMEDYDSVYVCGLELEQNSGIYILNFLEKYPDKTIYFAPGPRINSLSEEKLSRMFALHPILHLNKNEAFVYTKKTEVQECAKYLSSLTGNTVIITSGEDGCYCYDPSALSDSLKELTAAVKAAEVVDTTGAGDSHIGMVMALRSLGYPYYMLLPLANRVAAAVVAKRGATLTPEEFEALNIFERN